MAKPKKAKIAQPLKLDLGCGLRKQEGYKGVDLYAPGADFKVDLFKFPLPWKDNTVDEIWCSHFVEHIPRELRIPFFAECWRIMKLDAVMKIFVPSWKSERAFGDMTHEWPPVTSFFFLYLNRSWREANLLTYGAYATPCNFDYQAGPTGFHPSFADRNHEAQLFACQFYTDSYPDCWVTITKKA